MGSVITDIVIKHRLDKHCSERISGSRDTLPSEALQLSLFISIDFLEKKKLI